MSAIDPQQGFGGLLRSMGNTSCDLIGQVLSAVSEHLDGDLTFLAEFRGDLKVIRRSLCQTTPGLLEEGQCLPLQDTYCYRMVLGGLPNVVTDARNDPRVRDLAITRQLDIGSYASVPVQLPGGRLFGTLCCIKHTPDPALDERDTRFLRVLANLIGSQLEREASMTAEREARRTSIQAWIDRGPQMLFQPIVDLADGRLVGVEALARFDTAPERTPDRWFAEAWTVGLGLELELAAVRIALRSMGQLPGDAYLTVNVSPRTLLSDGFAELMRDVPRDRLVVEVTEHAIVDSYAELAAAVKQLAAQGIRVAIDDAGAGYSGLSHILRVAPRLVKLDGLLTQAIESDPVKQALVSAVVGFGRQTQVDIVAEGVETPGDASTLRQLGVQFGQGFHFARPAAMPLAPGG